AVRDDHEPPVLREDARHRRLERRGPGAREEDRREVASRRERLEQPGPDRRLQLAELRLAVAEITARERRRHARRDVHRTGVEEDHGAVPSACRRRAAIAIGVWGMRGPGGPGGPSAVVTSRKAGPGPEGNAGASVASAVGDST